MNKAPPFEEMQRAVLSRAVADLFAWRLITLPIGAVIVGGVFLFDASVARRSLVVVLYVTLSVVAVAQYLKYRTGADSTGALPGNALVVTVAQIALIAVTGGVESPAFPAIVVMGFIGGLFVPPRWTRLCLRIQVGSVLALVAVQAGWRVQLVPPFLGGGDAPSPPVMLYTRGVVGLLLVAGSSRVAARARETFDAVGRLAVRARDESLEGYAQETRAITTMAGAIAHELKNPLASVKALAQLVAKDMEGKGAERVAVLRGEADRMQGILEEFLNFSRPLVPLTQRDVRVEDLCADVVLLHESLALERKVAIVAPSGGSSGATVRCDPRKVKQVLINLVQNAIAASPAGSEIRIAAVEASGASGEGIQAIVCITVSDQGPGLPPEVAASVFEAGVTTKSGGSGLGLTVSRAIARQHGGELVLRSTAAGCVAELTLPRAGIAEKAER